MTQVAFTTYQQSPDLLADDRLVADILRTKGVSVTAAVWDDPRVDWSRFACVVIRSAWDYHHKPDQYAEWLRSRAADGTKLWNPANLVLANLNKRYLVDLAKRGVDVIPSEYVSAGSGRQLRQVLETHGWEEVVVKPAVSAGAHDTWRASLATVDTDQAKFEQQCRSTALLVQPYLEEVASEGEWSLVFFASQYSHAVLKRPTHGDFRVQQHFGGNFAAASPSPELIAQTEDVLSQIASPLLYARVDGVVRAGRFLLMELEINEPHLFIGCSAEAPSRFAKAIQAVL